MSLVEFGDFLYVGIEKNEYLNKLYSSILFNYSITLLGITHEFKAQDFSIPDALAFADILSKSTHSTNADKHKIWGQEIVALLNYLHPENESIRQFLSSVLTATGNYRGLIIPHLNLGEVGLPSLLDDVYHEISKELLDIPADKGKHFFRSQLQVYSKFLEPYFSFSGPTSMGKSFLMRMFIKHQIMQGARKNFAILVPTKALINETSAKITGNAKTKGDLTDYLAPCKYKVVQSPGSPFLKLADHNFIFILTPERMQYLLISQPHIKLDCLFVDEAHKIASKDARSAFYYKVIEMLSDSSRSDQRPATFFASPNIPNPEVFLKLIPDAVISDAKLASTFSPVSQIKYYIDFPNKKVFSFNNLNEDLLQLTPIKDDASITSILRHVGRDGKNLIYCRSKAMAVELAQNFAHGLTDIDDAEIKKLASDISTEIHEDCYLADLIRKGVAYHLGYLPSSIRMRIEELYKDGRITTLFCTSTLVEGVNLPADNLFITSYFNGKPELKEVDFANLVGRVGRIDFNLYGNVFLTRLEDNEDNKSGKFEALLKNTVPPQKLSLLSSELTKGQREKIVECLIQGEIELLRYPKSQSNENYELLRKFANILLRSILKNTKSIVREAFAAELVDGAEEKIRNAFANRADKTDDDINVSVDQTVNLYWAIKNGLTYPALGENGFIEYDKLLEFLYKLCDIFKWEKYEKSTLGALCNYCSTDPNTGWKTYCTSEQPCEKCKRRGSRRAQLGFYTVILNKWLQGLGLGFIVKDAIKYKMDNPKGAIKEYYKDTDGKSKVRYIDFDVKNEHSSLLKHKNEVIAETLDIVEQVILFRISNYFLKFSSEYKKRHGPDSLASNDWYEFVEFGTTNRLSIFFQKYDFSREAANYIKDNLLYEELQNGEYRIKRSILSCDKVGVVREISEKIINAPELFEPEI